MLVCEDIVKFTLTNFYISIIDAYHHSLSYEHQVIKHIHFYIHICIIIDYKVMLFPI